MGGVELQVGEGVVAVAPGALVEDVVPAALGAEIQRVAVREGLAQEPLHHEIPVFLPVLGGPAEGAGRATVGGVEVGFELPFAARQGTEDVVAGAQLPEVVAGTPVAALAVGEIALGEDPGGVGADRHPLGGLHVEAHGGHPGAERAGLQAHAPRERAVSEDRPGRLEGQAVLGVVHHGAAQGLEREHPEVVLAALEIAHPHAIQVDVGVGGAQAAQAHALQAGEPAVVAQPQAWEAQERIRDRGISVYRNGVRPGHDDTFVGHDGHGLQGVRRLCHQQTRRKQEGR